MAKMILTPLPKGFDTAQYKEGEVFDVAVTVHMTPKGLEVEAVEGMPVEMDESAAEEEAETEMDAAGLEKAMGRMATEE